MMQCSITAYRVGKPVILTNRHASVVTQTCRPSGWRRIYERLDVWRRRRSGPELRQHAGDVPHTPMFCDLAGPETKNIA